MPDPVLTQRALNRALLARQLLLERSTIPLEDAIEQVGGLQTQYAPSGYVGLWTRLAGFCRGALTEALENRTVIQATLLRTTIHMVTRREFWRDVACIRQARRTWALRTPGAAVSEPAMLEAARRMRGALAEGPRKVKELGELGAGFVGSSSERGRPAQNARFRMMKPTTMTTMPRNSVVGGRAEMVFTVSLMNWPTAAPASIDPPPCDPPAAPVA